MDANLVHPKSLPTHRGITCEKQFEADILASELREVEALRCPCEISALASPTFKVKACSIISVDCVECMQRSSVFTANCPISALGADDNNLGALSIRFASYAHTDLDAIVTLCKALRADCAAIHIQALHVPHRIEAQLQIAGLRRQLHDWRAQSRELICRVLLAFTCARPPSLARARASAAVCGALPELRTLAGSDELARWVHIDLHHEDLAGATLQTDALTWPELSDFRHMASALGACREDLCAHPCICILSERHRRTLRRRKAEHGCTSVVKLSAHILRGAVLG
mmetsp:Transcript_46486/g.122796  ORF Transcript_46486/g.122796 Transcript_46486/m.122796 type:complete len:286 (+) Transcript_46486:347-1204(+)